MTHDNDKMAMKPAIETTTVDEIQLQEQGKEKIEVVWSRRQLLKTVVHFPMYISMKRYQQKKLEQVVLGEYHLVIILKSSIRNG